MVKIKIFFFNSLHFYTLLFNHSLHILFFSLHSLHILFFSLHLLYFLFFLGEHLDIKQNYQLQHLKLLHKNGLLFQIVKLILVFYILKINLVQLKNIHLDFVLLPLERLLVFIFLLFSFSYSSSFFFCLINYYFFPITKIN